MKWGIGETRAVRDQSDHRQRLWENGVIDDLKGQVSEKEPAPCVSSVGQGNVHYETLNPGLAGAISDFSGFPSESIIDTRRP
jgi:hypothetical protein